MKMNRYPSWFPYVLLGIFGLLILSGLLLVPSALLFRMEWDVPWALPGDSRVAVAAIHVGAAMLALVSLGALLPVHMRTEWSKCRNRRSGIGIVALLAFLAVTGLCNLYAGDPVISKITSGLHMLLGLAVPLIVATHVFMGTRK